MSVLDAVGGIAEMVGRRRSAAAGPGAGTLETRLAGVVVAAHNEPYGDFSVDRPEFAAQFKGKNIRDPFRVGADIDAVSRATITITSAARAIRISARRMATQLLAPPSAAK